MSCSLSRRRPARETRRALAGLVFDEREVRDVELEEPGELVEQSPRDPGRAVGVEQRVREAADCCELAVARASALRLARPAGRRSRAGRDRASCGRSRRAGRPRAGSPTSETSGWPAERLLRDERLDAEDPPRRARRPGRPAPSRTPISRAATLSPQRRGHAPGPRRDRAPRRMSNGTALNSTAWVSAFTGRPR